MPEKTTVHMGKIANSTRAPLSAVNGFAALNEIVEAARECINIHEVEQTRRARIQAYEATEVARIKAAEAVLKDYFERAFTERRALYQEFFSKLDGALDEGNGEVLHDVVRGIVDIARYSPLSDMGDLNKLRAALDDPNQVWDL